ncbi:MAG: DUF393 domain-containing protein [Ignavibacteriales bacterium]|nr:DUF393 domain-containing protein [Ignavibacteriales bacterium]
MRSDLSKVNVNVELSHPVIFFDGVCDLCNGFVQFVIRRDPGEIFQFAPLQSNEAQRMLNKKHVGQMETIVLLERGEIFTGTTAVLNVVKRLRGLIRFFYAFAIVPAFLREPLYGLLARHRYVLFGRSDECMVPTPEIRHRFLSPGK